MSRKRIRELLRELGEELDRTDDLDKDTRATLESIGDSLAGSDTDDDDTLRDNVRELESRFAASHPTAERIAREIADLLSKMGI